jgi:hypothetical protein
VKYLLMIYLNPKGREMWEALPEADRAEGMRAHAELNEELAASGELIVTEALADPSQATQVSVRDGRAVTADGPFAEVKEFLAGFYLIECDGVERAVELAARLPEAPVGHIEVRPVMDLSAFDM